MRTYCKDCSVLKAKIRLLEDKVVMLRSRAENCAVQLRYYKSGNAVRADKRVVTLTAQVEQLLKRCMELEAKRDKAKKKKRAKPSKLPSISKVVLNTEAPAEVVTPIKEEVLAPLTSLCTKPKGACFICADILKEGCRKALT